MNKQLYNAYESFKEFKVEASSLKEFLQRYTKHKQHEGRGQEYVKARIESHNKDLEKYGYTFITHHDSVTGEIVSYYK